MKLLRTLTLMLTISKSEAKPTHQDVNLARDIGRAIVKHLGVKA